ncbi:hypothetical protein PsorP6_002726 [Peronosclerospora sorghi]|uniref:Uncharacterized protein n=1 Tax=Peronosclerospora sorghi TaxID=230839 RepID=A0ACC0WUP9_9STRA|nr:hypothetical protein PsorP6_002726 [Peronosclerospora sorghi]
MQDEHMKYPIELVKVKSHRAEREKVLLPREAELEAAKRLIKNRNYYDRKACSEFVKRGWTRVEWSSKSLKRSRPKGKEINWEQDTLERIPALKEIQKKIGRQPQTKSSSGSNKCEPFVGVKDGEVRAALHQEGCLDSGSAGDSVCYSVW